MQVDLDNVPKKELTLETGDIVIALGKHEGQVIGSYLVTTRIAGDKTHTLVNLNGHSIYLEADTLSELSREVHSKIDKYRHFPACSYRMTFVPR